jgi:hypothetical protein
MGCRGRNLRHRAGRANGGAAAYLAAVCCSSLSGVTKLVRRVRPGEVGDFAGVVSLFHARSSLIIGRQILSICSTARLEVAGPSSSGAAAVDA